MSDQNGTSRNPASPVNFIEPDKDAAPAEPGIVLCLSGGGYRAMLFHVGSHPMTQTRMKES